MSFLIAHMNHWESDAFFQVELFVLLASILLSSRTNNTNLFFISSGACFFTATGVLIHELSRDWPAHHMTAELSASTVLSGMLLSTFGTLLVGGFDALVAYTHTAITFGLCICLSIGVCTGEMEFAQVFDLELERCKLRAATFSAMHLVASVAVTARTFRGRKPHCLATTAEGEAESSSEIDCKINAVT